MQKILLIAFSLAICLPAAAQQFTAIEPAHLFADQQSALAVIPPDADRWARVRNIPSGASIHVNGRTHSAHCLLKTATDDDLTCVSGDGARTEVFSKSEIKKITLPHRSRSLLVGLAIGAGVGGITGAASSKDGFIPRGDIAAVLAILFGAIGAIIGALTDFTSATIYRS